MEEARSLLEEMKGKGFVANEKEVRELLDTKGSFIVLIFARVMLCGPQNSYKNTLINDCRLQTQ